MQKLIPASPLALTGLDAAINQMRSKSRKPLDERFVEFQLDALNSKLRVISLERSKDTGDYGKYSGSDELSYQKMALGTVLPFPIVYTGEYPVLFVKLRQWLQETYNLVLEENEFAVQNSPTPLINSSYLTQKPAADSAEIHLVALPTSGRFVSGGVLRLLLAPSNGPIYLPALVPASHQGSLARLVYPAGEADSPVGTKSIYNSSAVDCALELLWRDHAVVIDRSSADISVSSVDGQYSRLQINALTTARDSGLSAYYGSTTYTYRKMDLDAIIPTDLVYDNDYPVTFARMQQILKFAYDLSIEENEFYVEGGNGAALMSNDTISAAANSDGQLVLVVATSSNRWLAGGKLRLKLIPSS